jgi:hypothetical protein
MVGRPTVFAAVIAGASAISVGAAAAITGLITAYYQYKGTMTVANLTHEIEIKKIENLRASDAAKLEATMASDAAKLQTTILLELVQKPNPEREAQTATMLKSGVLQDKSGNICQAFVGHGCPIKP